MTTALRLVPPALVCVWMALLPPVASAQSRVTSQELLDNATQLVVVTTPAWDSTAGELRRFIRGDTRSAWRGIGAAVPIVVGRTGLAWGIGIDRTGPHKKEGDGKSPAGVFAIGTAFGFAPADSMRWIHLPYLQLTPGTECVDDITSAHYNTVVERGAVQRVDWTSSERMREVKPYKLGAVILYNASPPSKSSGSCIFFHIWGGPRSTTAGCTALEESELTRLIAWIDPRRHPVTVQLPLAEYARLRTAWKLPQRGGGQ